MSYPVNDFIAQAFLNAYANEVIADSKGDLFTVRAVDVSSDMDGFQVTLYDRHHSNNEAWLKAYGGLPYEVEERRLLSLTSYDSLPTIVNLAWDKKDTKTWVRIPPRHERDNKPHPLNLP